MTNPIQPSGVSNAPIRTLLIEDDEADAALVVAMLNKDACAFDIVREESLANAERLIDAGEVDVVLLDLDLTDSDPSSTLDRLQSIASRVATIILTGNSDPLSFQGAIGQGAQDCIPKCELPSRLIGRDIQHAVIRHQAEMRLAREGRQASEESHAKTNFVSAMSHEIRTPLNALLGMAELLSNSSLDEQQRVYVQVFRRSGQALLSLINGILDLASIERGKFELITSTFSVREIVEETVGQFAFVAHKKRLALIAEIDPAVPQLVEGDAERLRQILSNLLSNAIKFTATGHVTLFASAEPDSVIQFEVRDSGIGVDSEKLAAIFQPFVQSEHDPEHVYEGTGLGLALCHNLSERMGGSIHAEPTESKGAHIVLRLPLPAKTPEPSQAEVDFKGRALVAVGSAEEFASIERFCLRAGVAVEAAPTTSAAIQKLANPSAAYDFLIVDCRVPDSGGMCVVESLRDKPDRPRCVVLLPMDHRPGDTKRCTEIGADSMIKPVRERRLQEWLEESGAGSDDNESATPNAAPASRRASLRPGLRILHADDSADNRLLVDAYLREEACEIVEAFDGVSAVEKFVAVDFDVVLMDVLMPRMDGLEATRRIRAFEQREGRSPTPIIALTANAFAEQIELCERAGTTLHVAKPLSQKMLLDGLRSVLDIDDVQETPCEDDSMKTTIPPVDFSQLDPDIAAILPHYLERRSEELDTMRTDLANRDFEPLRVAAHNLKGTGAGYGLPQLTEIGSRIEIAAKASDFETIETGIEELDRVVIDALGALSRDLPDAC